MKKTFVILFLFTVVINMYSQDTIRFVNKSFQAVKLNEIGIDAIKYHRADNLDGPLYIANKKDIEYIKFANGQVDSITIASKSKVITANENIIVYKQANPILSNEKIFISGNRLSYNGKAIGESRLYRMIISEPNQDKKTVLLKEYFNMKSYKKKQYLFGFVGLGAGLALPYAGLMTSFVTDDEAPILIGLAAGLMVGVTGAVISSIYKSKRLKKKIEIAKLYNN